MAGSQRGDRNPRWAGGVVESEGYRFIALNGHPHTNARGYVREHILVAERALKKYLPHGAVVHHANGTRNDNRPDNLVICENESFHRLLHQRQRAYEATGNPEGVKCQRCKRWGLVGHGDMVAYKDSPYHLSCAAAYSKARRRAKKEEGL